MNIKRNCRPGDIAWVTQAVGAAKCGFQFVIPYGTFVRVVKVDWKDSALKRRWMWVVEPVRLKSTNGVARCDLVGIADSVLRPIRPGDGEDEMLRIAGRPKSIKSTVPTPMTEPML